MGSAASARTPTVVLSLSSIPRFALSGRCLIALLLSDEVVAGGDAEQENAKLRVKLLCECREG